MYYTVYQTVNKINNMIYIGKHQTKKLDDNYLGSGKRLKRAIKKYGIENFEKEILFVFDDETTMNSKEAELVTEAFCSRDDTYNLCSGGHGGFGYINSKLMSPEIRTKAGKNGGVNSFSREQRIEYGRRGAKSKIANGVKINPYAFAGKKHSEETKQKMRKSKNVGENNSQFGTIWITNGYEAKKIYKSESIPAGWNRGRKIKRGT